MKRIIDFFNTKITDIVAESFWTGSDSDYRNPACSQENSLLDLFPEASDDISTGELLIMNYNKSRRIFETQDDTDYDVTYQLLYFLAIAVIHSDNDKIKQLCDMDISEFCSVLKKTSSSTPSDLYSMIMCFRDDCFSFVDEVQDYYNYEDYEEFFYIGNMSKDKNIGNIITLAAKILTAPECYIDYDAAAAYQSYIDTDGAAGYFEDNSEKLINNAQNILRYILYVPYLNMTATK